MSKETRKFFFEVYKDDIDEAINQNSVEIAKRMIAKNKYTSEEIADNTNLPIQTILELAGEKSA